MDLFAVVLPAAAEPAEPAQPAEAVPVETRPLAEPEAEPEAEPVDPDAIPDAVAIDAERPALQATDVGAHSNLSATGQALTVADGNPVQPETEAQSLQTVWAVYALSAVVFLIIAWRFMRNWRAWLRIPLWAAMAAGALTPAATPTASYWAPAVLVAILGAEAQGSSGFFRGAVPIGLVFAGVLLLLTGLHWMLQKRAPARD